MKKTLVKFFAGVTAAASLLMAGCTNQLDYLDETVALNKFNVLGLYVEGLNESYNNAPVTLSVKEGEDFVSYAEGKVADSYTKDGKVVGYKSGTAYIKLDTPKVFDGDKLETSTFECYITVGADKFLKVAADGLTTENAKLSVPTSPAKTKNADLKGRWVTVNVANGTPTYSLESSAKEPVNVTLYNIKLDLLSCTAETLPTGVTVSKVAKEGTNQKFTLKLTGLKDNAGTDVVLGGSDISSTDKDLKDNWHDRTNFKKTISAEGTVEWTFYGSAVNGGNISAWGRTYTAEQAGPEIVIVDTTGKDQNDGNKLLQSSVSRNGVAGDSMNFMFPAYTIGDYDVTCTIDVAALADSSKSKADPVATEYSYEVAKITVRSKSLATAKTVLGADGKLFFMDGTLTGEGKWTEKSTNFVIGSAITVTGSGENAVGTVSFDIPLEKQHTYYPAGEMSLVKTPTVQVVYIKAGETEFGADCKNVVKVLKGEECGKIYDFDYARTKVELVIDADKNTFEFEKMPIKISKVRVVNCDVADGTKIYFLDGNLLGTSVWNENETTYGLVASKKAEYTLATPYETTAAEIGCQIVYIKSGETAFGDSWVNVTKICNENNKVENKYDDGTYILEYDAKENKYSLKNE